LIVLNAFRRRLGWKLFLSYLVVIFVGVIVLASTAELAIPRSFNRHLASMASMMGDTGMGMDMELNSDLFSNFRKAVNESLFLAALASFSSAIVVSLIISRRVVAPVLEMKAASQHIAEGNYVERVLIQPSKSIDEYDELEQLAISFNQMAEKLEKTENMRRELIGDVAHELRTPLTTIKGSMEGLIDGVLEPKVETFQQMYQEADRLQRLVNDLQELSRVEAGFYELERKPRSIPALIQATRERIGRQFEEKEIRLEVDLPPNLSMVAVDEHRIGQVLLNLVGNALQYTPPGGGVTIGALEQDGWITVSIHDSGIGISPEHLPHLFSRFYRVDKSRARASGGSGIGLTIAKHIIEAHGGRIWAESPGHNQGSTFTFTLPVH
jgi:histidine kinase